MPGKSRTEVFPTSDGQFMWRKITPGRRTTHDIFYTRRWVAVRGAQRAEPDLPTDVLDADGLVVRSYEAGTVGSTTG